MLPTDNPIVLNNLAWIYLETGDERALEMARLADQAAPKNPDIEDTLGWVLVENGAAGEGLSYLRASARARPQNATIQYHLGVAYQRVGDSEGARGALKKALALGDFPERGDAQRRLSEI
jgi:Flp pilus assembly protein TadD